MKTPIADMILEMHGKGIPVELIASAVARLEEAMAARAVSTGIPVDTSTIDKRRAWDRDRKRRQKAARLSTGIPPDSTGIPPERHSILKEESSLQGKVVKEKKESKLLRGSRIPPEFVIDEDDYKFAAALGFSREEADAETAHFKDYWASVAGAKGVKLTWKGTWRNRMRDLKKYSRSQGATNPVRTDSAAGRATTREAQLIAAVGRGAANRLAERAPTGPDGPAPGSSGSAEVFDFGKRAESAR